MLPPSLFWPLLLAVCGYAFWRGGRDERAAAAVCLLGSLASSLALPPLQLRYSDVEVGVLLIDGVALAVFTAIALRSNRFWPLWVAGLQLTTSVAHFIKALNLDLMPHAYAAALRFWIYPILLILVLGTWRGQRQLLEPAPGPAS
jgi:hypothetical protein